MFMLSGTALQTSRRLCYYCRTEQLTFRRRSTRNCRVSTGTVNAAVLEFGS